MLGVDWKPLVERGYVHVRGLVALDLVARARAAIDDELRRNYDPAREDEYSSRTYCPAIELDAEPVPDLGEVRWNYLSNLWRGWRVGH